MVSLNIQAAWEISPLLTVLLGCVENIANLYELYIHVTVHRNRFIFK